MFKIIVDFINNLFEYWWGPTIGILIYLLVYFFTHPDKIAIWSSLIASLFEKLSKRSARHSVASDMQSRISSYIKNNHADKIFPYGLKFKWITKGKTSSYLNGNDIVIIMDYHHNNAKNFTNMLGLYTKQAFLPFIRNELPSNILIAAELLIQEKIILEKRPDALNFFQEDIFNKNIQKNNEIKLIYDKFKKLDKWKYFDNIFLEELVFVGQRLKELDFIEKNNEIQNFLTFLMNIDDETKPLFYNTDIFHLNITIAAKHYTKENLGIQPYIVHAEKALTEKLDSLYVTGRDQNIAFVDEITDEIKKKKIGKIEWIRDYKIRDIHKNNRDTKMVLFRL